MNGDIFKIIFKEDKAYLTPEKALTLKEAGLPDTIQSFKSPATWTIKVINYIPKENKIYCEILKYEAFEDVYSSKQVSNKDILNSITTITPKSIDTNGLLNTTFGGKTLTVLPSYEKEEVKKEPKIFVSNPTNQSTQNELIIPEVKVEIPKQPIIIQVKDSFYIPIKALKFKLGGVTFERFIKEYGKSIEFTISNYDIREEFDAVKNYFANILKTKKIFVELNLEIAEKNYTIISINSPEINKINNNLIENIRFEFVKETIKKRIKIEIDKSLFTMDEYFDHFTEEKVKSNTFYTNDKQLFEDIISITGTKHYKNLRYLSSKHCHNTMKLRFILKPFSFLFLLEGKKHYHLIWETLNTEEATYIWHIEKDMNILKQTVRKIEDIVNVIKVQGKTAYINSNEDPFRRIYHDYSQLVDGFVKWKGEVENVLT